MCVNTVVILLKIGTTKTIVFEKRCRYNAIGVDLKILLGRGLRAGFTIMKLKYKNAKRANTSQGRIKFILGQNTF